MLDGEVKIDDAYSGGHVRPENRIEDRMGRRVLQSLPYAGRDLDAIGKADPKIIGDGPGFLNE